MWTEIISNLMFIPQAKTYHHEPYAFCFSLTYTSIIIVMSSISRLSLPSRPMSTSSKNQTPAVIPKSRGRSNSFASALKRLLPSNRPERGGTLRGHGAHYSESRSSSSIPISKSVPSAANSSGHAPPSDELVIYNTATDSVSQPTGYTSTTSPSSRSQQLYLDHRERRRRRRSLKESGDYLGVQGINPRTGEMDVVTPSTSTTSSPFVSLTRAVQDKRLAYENARKALRSEKLRKWEMDKAALKTERRRKVRWTRRGEQWSSAVEPDLSPITGSSGASTPRKAEKSTETVIRTPSDRSSREIEISQNFMSTACPTRKGSTSSTIAGHGIPRKPVPISSRTLSSSRSYSDLITVESEFPKPPPPPPKDQLAPVG